MLNALTANKNSTGTVNPSATLQREIIAESVKPAFNMLFNSDQPFNTRILKYFRSRFTRR